MFPPEPPVAVAVTGGYGRLTVQPSRRCRRRAYASGLGGRRPDDRAAVAPALPIDARATIEVTVIVAVVQPDDRAGRVDRPGEVRVGVVAAADRELRRVGRGFCQTTMLAPVVGSEP